MEQDPVATAPGSVFVLVMKNSLPTKRRDPFPFVLEELSAIRPTIKRWFGFTSVYLDEKLLCSLCDSTKQPNSNGIWLYTTTEHLESLAKEFPDLPKRQLWRSRSEAMPGWYWLPDLRALRNMPSRPVSLF